MRNLWNWVTWHQTPAHWCVTTVFKPHWALVLHQRSPLSHLPLFFFFLREDPWIISFWNRGGMNKSFIASFKLTEILSVQLNISDWRDHSAKVAEPCKVKLMGEIFNFVLEKCSLQSPQTSFIFHPFSSPSAYVYQWEGRGRRRCVFSLVLSCSRIYRLNLITEPSQKGVSEEVWKLLFYSEFMWLLVK